MMDAVPLLSSLGRHSARLNSLTEEMIRLEVFEQRPNHPAHSIASEFFTDDFAPARSRMASPGTARSLSPTALFIGLLAANAPSALATARL